MTNEKAIIILQGLRSSYICDPNECPLEEKDDNHILCKGCDENHEALVMAIDALENQAERWGMATEAYRKIDEIERIVRFEVGNRHEIENKVLAVIRGA